MINSVARQERIGVIGAGIIGCAVAFELVRRGAEVTMFDGRRLGGGATQASAGILAPYIEAHADPALIDLAVRGLDAYDDFVQRIRLATTMSFEYQRRGSLEIAEDEMRARELRARQEAPWAADAGLEWLEAAALRARAPFIASDALGGLFCAAHGHVGVRPLVEAVAAAARSLGATIHLETPIVRIDVSSPRIAVHTQRQHHQFDRVVVCTGAWTHSIDPGVATAGGIRPVRGQIVRLLAPELAGGSVLWGAACYIVPWGDGSVLVGATAEDVGFDERATVDGVRSLLAAATALVPALGSATFTGVRVGLRPASASGLPILGPGADPRIIYAVGHFRNGVLLAPLTATLIAGYIFDNTIDPVFSVG